MDMNAAISPSMFAYSVREKIRFSDVDRNDHANNIALCRYLEDVRFEFRKKALANIEGSDREAWYMVSLNVDFGSSAYFAEEVEVALSIEKIGRSSIRYVQAIFVGERLVCKGRSTAICVDRSTGKSMSIPQPYIDQFERYLWRHEALL